MQKVKSYSYWTISMLLYRYSLCMFSLLYSIYHSGRLPEEEGKVEIAEATLRIG